MIKYKVKLSNLQLTKLKSGIKTGTAVTLNHSSKLVGNSNNETNFHISYYELKHKFREFVMFLYITLYYWLKKKNKKGLSSITGSGITPANNEIKDIMKVIRFLEKNEFH